MIHRWSCEYVEYIKPFIFLNSCLFYEGGLKSFLPNNLQSVNCSKGFLQKCAINFEEFLDSIVYSGNETPLPLGQRNLNKGNPLKKVMATVFCHPKGSLAYRLSFGSIRRVPPEGDSRLLTEKTA